MIDSLGPWTGSLLSVALVSVLPLAVTLAMARNEWTLRRFLPQLTAFGAGAVFGAAVVHIIPEALGAGRPLWVVAAAVLTGYLAFWMVERALAGHDHAHAHGMALGAPSAHHDDTSEAECRHLAAGEATPSGMRALVPMAFAGDAVHNVVDGMLIAAGFLVEPRVGLLTLLAVALHELPREIGTFSLFVHGGIRPMRAVGYNLVTAVLGMAGAAATLLVGTQMTEIGGWLLPVAAGTYLYIAQAVGRASLQDRRSDPTRWGRLGWGAAGVLLMGATAAW
jgi:zinc and cadmium transporter